MFKKHISFVVAKEDLTKVLDRFVGDIQVDVNASKVKRHYFASIHCDSQQTKHYLNVLMELVRYGAGIHNIDIC